MEESSNRIFIRTTQCEIVWSGLGNRIKINNPLRAVDYHKTVKITHEGRVVSDGDLVAAYKTQTMLVIKLTEKCTAFLQEGHTE